MNVDKVLDKFGHDGESLATEVHDRIASDKRQPLFYAISGSHAYGFPDEDSDLDIRGFHLSRKRWDMLDEPDEQVHLGGSDAGEIDIISYELLKYGKLLAKGNFNVIELLFGAPIVYESPNSRVKDIYERIKDNLPLDLPTHYRGMAKQNYYKYLDNPASESYRPIPKKYLYVLRGLLAARYVVEENGVEPDINALKEMHPHTEHLVDELIEKKTNSDTPLKATTIAYASDLIDEMIEEDSFEYEYDRKAWEHEVDEWMRTVRGLAG